jgi:hypothetical protein
VAAIEILEHGDVVFRVELAVAKIDRGGIQLLHLGMTMAFRNRKDKRP